jgi:transcriptional regulator with XRE-family HTH domain
MTKRRTQAATFGQRLREERERLQMTQQQFAELGGVKRVTQHLYEMSERHPDVRYLEALALHGVDVHYLVLGRRLSEPRGEVQLPGEVLDEIYRAVEEFARDSSGNPMPLDAKINIFRFLRAALDGSSHISADELRARLQRMVRAA